MVKDPVRAAKQSDAADAADAAESPRLADLLCFSIYAVSHAFGRVYRPLLDRLGLTYPQFLVMVSLWEQDGRTVGDLGALLFLESSTLTPLLKRLEALGYVTRQRSPKDERQVVIRLTPKGAALRQDSQPVARCVAEATGLDRAAADRLRTEVERLREALRAFDGAAG